jgi:hypothetical protein
MTDISKIVGKPFDYQFRKRNLNVEKRLEDTYVHKIMDPISDDIEKMTTDKDLQKAMLLFGEKLVRGLYGGPSTMTPEMIETFYE